MICDIEELTISAVPAPVAIEIEAMDSRLHGNDGSPGNQGAAVHRTSICVLADIPHGWRRSAIIHHIPDSRRKRRSIRILAST